MRKAYWLAPIIAIALAGCSVINDLLPPIEIGGWFNPKAIPTGETFLFSADEVPPLPDMFRLVGVGINAGRLVPFSQFSQVATVDPCGVAKLELTLAIAGGGGELEPFFSGTIPVNPATCDLDGSTLSDTFASRTPLSAALSHAAITGSATIDLFDGGNNPVSKPFALTFSEMQIRIGF
jgi:hypothetical protein